MEAADRSRLRVLSSSPTAGAFTIEQRRSQEVVGAYDTRLPRTRALDQQLGRRVRREHGRERPSCDPYLIIKGGCMRARCVGEFRSLDAANRQIDLAEKHHSTTTAPRISDWGMAASPLIVGDAVVVASGGGNGKSVVAYNEEHRRAPLVRARRSASSVYRAHAGDAWRRRQILV